MPISSDGCPGDFNNATMFGSEPHSALKVRCCSVQAIWILPLVERPLSIANMTVGLSIAAVCLHIDIILHIGFTSIDSPPQLQDKIH